MRSEESEEFTKLRRDQEEAEAHRSLKDRKWKTHYPGTSRIKEVDPRERD